MATTKRYKYNKFFIINNEYCIGYDEQQEHCFYIDVEDLEKIEKYYWRFDKSKGYWVATICADGERKNICMHKYLFKSNLECVDHIDRNRSNNRKDNLRSCTRTENNRNRSISKRNKSGVSGVFWDKLHKKWRAEIMSNNKLKTLKSHFLGYYENKEDAIKARLLAEKEYFGTKFAPQKNLFAQYGVEEE